MKKRKNKLPEKQAYNLIWEILDCMFIEHITNKFIKIGKKSFYNNKTGTYFFFKNYNEALKKLQETKDFNQLSNNNELKQIIKESIKTKVCLLSFQYNNDLVPEFTNLPVYIWLNKSYKHLKNNKYFYPRLTIQNTTKLVSNIKNIITIKLYPNIEIIENLGYKNELTKTEEIEILKWINKYKIKLINISYHLAKKYEHFKNNIWDRKYDYLL